LLPGDVRDHEPRLALLDTKSPGRDGLGFYRAIAAAAALHLEPGGLLAFEVGASQAARVREILQSAGYAVGETIKDYGGIERVVTARRAAD
jgi:release factor glutamine methyltransferase